MTLSVLPRTRGGVLFSCSPAFGFLGPVVSFPLSASFSADVLVLLAVCWVMGLALGK